MKYYPFILKGFEEDLFQAAQVLLVGEGITHKTFHPIVLKTVLMRQYV